MIRNHAIDPESPAKLSINPNNNATASEFDDPWYAPPSHENSPTNSSMNSSAGMGSGMKPFGYFYPLFFPTLSCFSLHFILFLQGDFCV